MAAFPDHPVPHDPRWKLYYKEEKDLLMRYFGDIMVMIFHIGSTAVEGLIAKPTVDIPVWKVTRERSVLGFPAA